MPHTSSLPLLTAIHLLADACTLMLQLLPLYIVYYDIDYLIMCHVMQIYLLELLTFFGEFFFNMIAILMFRYWCSYGTGAIMAVPAHDTRDYEFALKYDIPIRWVVTPEDKSLTDSRSAFPGQGLIINSSNSMLGLDINGLSSKEAASKVIEWADKTGNGKKKVPFSVNLKFKDRSEGVGVVYNTFYICMI